jgi:hypothetical protein
MQVAAVSTINGHYEWMADNLWFIRRIGATIDDPNELIVRMQADDGRASPLASFPMSLVLSYAHSGSTTPARVWTS